MNENKWVIRKGYDGMYCLCNVLMKMVIKHYSRCGSTASSEASTQCQVVYVQGGMRRTDV